MCGRYRLTAKERYLRDHFGLDEDLSWAPRWNIAPTQQIPTVRQHPKEPRRIFSLMRWGLIPHWAKDASIGLRTINAMSETAAEKPVFRDAFRFRRCLIPADGFYEWKKIGPKQKQPYDFSTLDGSVFAFAGLWDRYRQRDKSVQETCAILTNPPNALVAEVHDRMSARPIASQSTAGPAPLTVVCPSPMTLRMQESDMEALGLLFHRYSKLTLGIARRVLRDNDEAEDLVQEIFLFLYFKSKLFDPTSTSIRYAHIHIHTYIDINIRRVRQNQAKPFSGEWKANMLIFRQEHRIRCLLATG